MQISINKIPILFTLFSALFYIAFAYDLERTDYFKLITLYIGLFVFFYKLVQIADYNFKFLVFVSFLFRILFIFSIPNLSQDFYRFIWDGRIILEGINPYLFTPESFISNEQFPVAQAQDLYNGMGALNAGHYSNYPPLNQLCFVIAGFITGKSILGSVIVLRTLIIIADFGTLYFGKKLLNSLNIPVQNIFWYILNPFIIIELTGNLHFEAIMIFFLVWSLYLLHKQKWIGAGVLFALSVSIKLIPLLFLPLFIFYFLNKDKIDVEKVLTTDGSNMLNSANEEELGNSFSISVFNRKWMIQTAGLIQLIAFYIIIGLINLLLFVPFLSYQFIDNYLETIGLWFFNFEFNASIYYIAREIGYRFRGWNEIAIIGSIIPIVIIVFLLIITFFKRNKTTIDLITSMLFVLSFYYFTATTVHPWYIATLLILSIFTKYIFVRVWSFIVIISYLAYANSNNSENLWIIGLEYLVVYGVLLWELLLRPNKTKIKKNYRIV